MYSLASLTTATSVRTSGLVPSILDGLQFDVQRVAGPMSRHAFKPNLFMPLDTYKNSALTNRRMV